MMIFAMQSASYRRKDMGKELKSVEGDALPEGLVC